MTRTPSAGNERIRDDEFRRIISLGLDVFRRLDDEGPRALRVAREWEGHARAAASGEGGGGSDVPDPTGTLALSPDAKAGTYGVLVDYIRHAARPLAGIASALDVLKASDVTDDETAKLERINATAGQCDACGRHHTGQRKPHDDRLKVAPQTDPPRLYGPDCYSAWVRNLAATQPATVRVFERMRATRQERDGAA